MKTKFLKLVTPLLCVAAATPFAVTSCNKKISNNVSYYGEKTIKVSETKEFLMYFELNHNLTSDETLHVSLNFAGSVVFAPKSTIIVPDKIDIELPFEITSTESGVSEFELKFYSTDKLLNELWSCTITDLKLIYTK